MTSPSNHEHHADHLLDLARGPGRRPSLPVWRTAAQIATLLGLAVLAAACGGSNNSNHTPASSGGLMAQFLAVSRCMRSHGVPDFPDPTTSGGVGIVLRTSVRGATSNPEQPEVQGR